MSHLVLARKYRPGSFASVAGQVHVTRILKNAIIRDKVGHAYLFAGPRGVGKTSIARIFAKALNCATGPTAEPCLECVNCREITAGTSMAVIEIDGASHNSVDNVRDIIDSTRTLAPPGSRYKIFIIDEVHMLSTSAFNALLKSLEEPPPHTIFMMATTDPQKIPETVLSRVQRHDLRSITPDVIQDTLARIAQKEGIGVSPEALRLLSRHADGSLRDAEVLLEQVIAFADGDISEQEVSGVLGTVDSVLLGQLIDAVIDRDSTVALGILDDIFCQAVDVVVLLKEFVAHWRDLLLFKFGGETLLKRGGVPGHLFAELEGRVSRLGGRELEDLATLLLEEADAAVRSYHPRFFLEAMIVRLCHREAVVDLARAVNALEMALQQAGGDASGGGSAIRSSNEVHQQAVAPREGASAVQSAGGRPSEVRASSRNSTIASASSRAVVSHNVAEDSSLGTTRSEQQHYIWYDFVKYLGDTVSPFLAEQLKRLSADEFSGGRLVLHGPAFSLGTFEEPAQRAKILAALHGFTGIEQWRISTKSLEGGRSVAPGSPLEVQQQRRNEERSARDKMLRENPTVQTVQKFFPQSTIERKED